MTIRPPANALRLRALAAATGLVLASTLLVPGAALAANGPPHPNTDTITTNEDTPATGNVLANDTNGGQGPLIVVGYTALAPSIGTLTIDADGNYVFTPAANWNGSTSTSYQVANNKHTRTGTINITVLAVNDPPTANDDTVSATEDTPANVTAALLANDTDPDADTLAVTGVANAAGGTVGLVAGVVTFTADANACGTGEGSFDYTISDGHGGTDTGHATVNVTCVNDAPTAVDDGASGTEDTNVVIVAADLAANDTDPEGDALTVTGVSNATGGTVGLVAGTITFSPAANLCGTASAGFDYTVDDGNGGTDTGHVSIDLTCVNDAPVANDDTVTVEHDSTDNDVTAAILANDTDTEGDTLAVTSVDNATGGTVDLTAGVVTFTPTGGECGTGEGSFDYTVDDGNGGSDTGHVTVDVNCELNVPPVANDDTVSATEDTDAVIAGGDLTGNDTDGNGDALTVSAVANPTGGTVDVTAGTVTFTPTANLCGTGAGSFDYTVVDGKGGTDTGHVTVDITCVDDAPTANDDSATVAQDSSANDLTATLLANDTDPEGDTLAVSAVANPVGGTADVTAGVVTFTPTADLCGTGAGSFDYTVDDGNGGTDDGHVTIDITCTPNTAAGRHGRRRDGHRGHRSRPEPGRPRRQRQRRRRRRAVGHLPGQRRRRHDRPRRWHHDLHAERQRLRHRRRQLRLHRRRRQRRHRHRACHGRRHLRQRRPGRQRRRRRHGQRGLCGRRLRRAGQRHGRGRRHRCRSPSSRSIRARARRASSAARSGSPRPPGSRARPS